MNSVVNVLLLPQQRGKCLLYSPSVSKCQGMIYAGSQKHMGLNGFFFCPLPWDYTVESCFPARPRKSKTMNNESRSNKDQVCGLPFCRIWASSCYSEKPLIVLPPCTCCLNTFTAEGSSIKCSCFGAFCISLCHKGNTSPCTFFTEITYSFICQNRTEQVIKKKSKQQQQKNQNNNSSNNRNWFFIS